MKKLFSIAFVLILMLNVMGYYGVFVGMQYQNDMAMTKVLDSNAYDEAHAVTIKIPVSIPYMTDNADFERVNGKFEHEGNVYRLVKQKYAKDTLTVVCVKDFEDQRINQALTKYVKTFADKASDEQSGSKVSFNFIKDYLTQDFSILAGSEGLVTDVILNSFQRNLIPTFSSSVVHPPERA